MNIFRFTDNYEFLSNFYECIIIYEGKEYKSVEHVYQAYKSLNESEREWIRTAPTATLAKSFGRKIKIRKDWDNVKYNLMLDFIRIKFKNPELKELLLKTGNDKLIEGNYWHDNIWGDCHCNKCKNIKGLNWLGEILMTVREEIKK